MVLFVSELDFSRILPSFVLGIVLSAIPATGSIASDDLWETCTQRTQDRNRPRSIDACTKWLATAEAKKDRTRRALSFFHRGNNHFEIGQLDLALADFSQSIRLNSKNSSAFNERGRVQTRKKQFDRAVRDFASAIQLDPDRSIYYSNRGLSYAEKGDHARAIQDFSKAIELSPTFASAFNDRGVTYEKRGELDRALADFDKAIELNPDYALAYRNRGKIYATRRSGRDFGRAIENYDRSILLDPAAAPTYALRADAHAGAGNRQQAVADYDAALARDPGLKLAATRRDKVKASLAARPQAETAEAQDEKNEPASAPTVTVAPGRRVALTIGINTYQNIDSLRNALNDAEAVAQALTQIGYEVIRGQDLKRSGFNRSLLDFEQRIGPNDTTVFFFAGHGVAINGENYLLPADVPGLEAGEDGLLRSEAFKASEIIDRIKSKGAKVAVLVLDACRDNPFKRGGTRSVGATRGLERMQPPRGTFVLFSAGAGDVAHDRLGPGDASRNSVFTRVLAEELKKPGARLVDIAIETQKRVNDLARAARKEQIPAYYDEFAGFLTLH